MKTCPQCQSTITKTRNTFCDRTCANKFHNALRVTPELPVEEFRRRRRQYRTNWKEKDPQKAKKVERRQFETYYNTTKGRAEHMLNNARARAKRKGISITLTRDWIQERLDAGVCEATGIQFVLQSNGGKGHNVNSFSPSVDRIDQTGDYTPDNCRIVVWIYNRARGAFPDGDFDILLDALAKKLVK